MNRHNFDNKWRAVVNSKEEMDRKWRAFLREQEDMAMAQRAAVSSAPASGPLSEAVEIINQPATIHFFLNASDNIAFTVMNYSTGLISEPFDTGIAYNGGSSYIQTRYNNIQNSGFMPVIFDSVNSRNYAFFVTANGVVLDQIYTGGGYSDAQLDQYMTFFADYEPDGAPTYGILKMFDGVRVTTTTLDGVTGLNWGFGTGDVTSDYTVLFDFNATGDFNLVNMAGTVTPILTSVPEARPTFYVNWTHKYVCAILYDETDAGLYKGFKVWDSDGSLLQDYNISAFGVDQFVSGELYGTDNRFMTVLANSADANVDYLIIHYDYNTNTTIIDTHEKGVNFPNINFYATDLEKWNPSNAMKTNGVIVFSKDGAHSAPVGFSPAEYLDVWCMHHDLQAFTKTDLVTQDEVGYRISTNQEEGAIYSGDPVLLYYNFSGATFSDIRVGSFTSSGFVNFDLGIDPEDLDGISSVECIAPTHNYFWYETLSDPSTRSWRIFNSTGTVIETHQTSTATDFSSGPMYDAFVLLDLEDFANCITFSPARGLETLPDPSPNTYAVLAYNDIENEFGTTTGYSTRNAIIQTIDGVGPIGFQIYNNTSGLQAYSELPLGSIQNFLMGETIVYYSYLADGTSLFSSVIYDITTGAQLTTMTTPYTDPPGSLGNVGDRIWGSWESGSGTYDLRVLTRAGSVSLDLGPTVIDTGYNDAFWIND